MQHFETSPELESVTLLKTNVQNPLAGKNCLSLLLKDSFQYFGFQKVTPSTRRKISFISALNSLPQESPSRPLLICIKTGFPSSLFLSKRRRIFLKTTWNLAGGRISSKLSLSCPSILQMICLTTPDFRMRSIFSLFINTIFSFKITCGRKYGVDEQRKD